jgi:hypothetical protein
MIALLPNVVKMELSLVRTAGSDEMTDSADQCFAVSMTV